MYSDRRGYGQKPPRTKPSRQKTPGQRPSRTIEREFVQGAFVRIFCTRPTKNRGVPRCVTYFWGVPGCVTKCDGGGGSKLAKNCVTHFMDGHSIDQSETKATTPRYNMLVQLGDVLELLPRHNILCTYLYYAICHDCHVLARKYSRGGDFSFHFPNSTALVPMSENLLVTPDDCIGLKQKCRRHFEVSLKKKCLRAEKEEL